MKKEKKNTANHLQIKYILKEIYGFDFGQNGDHKQHTAFAIGNIDEFQWNTQRACW